MAVRLVIGAVAWLFAGNVGLARAQDATTARPSSPAPVPAPDRAGTSRGPADALGIPIPLPRPFREGGERSITSPGLPPSGGRPMPGTLIDPGASGPGIGSTSRDLFLGGALERRSGWPFVLLHFFTPRPEQVEKFWVVHTRDCPQVMGSDPWANLKVLHFDAQGELVPRDPSEFLAQAVGRPVLIQVQGNLTTPDIALGGLMWSSAWLQQNRALSPDPVVIAFDWPSQRISRNDVRDVNEKGRRAYIAGCHLARFLSGFPLSSRITLLGQSFGGRVVLSALHLLGGGCLNSQDHDSPVRLPALRPDLHLRGILLAAASDHDWLGPNQRFDRALHSCEGLLNLYNRRDEALVLYPFLRRSGRRRALGRIGLRPSDFDRLGPLAARYEEHDIYDQLNSDHTLLDAVANPQIARWMAPYLWAGDPGSAPRGRESGPIPNQPRLSLRERPNP